MDGSPVLLILWLVFLVAVMYLLMIRPQQKRLQAHRALVESLSVGQNIVTMGGIHGTIQGLGDDTVDVRIAENVIVTISRSAVAARVEEPKSEGPGDDSPGDASSSADDPADEGMDVDTEVKAG